MLEFASFGSSINQREKKINEWIPSVQRKKTKFLFVPKILKQIKKEKNTYTKLDVVGGYSTRGLGAGVIVFLRRGIELLLDDWFSSKIEYFTTNRGRMWEGSNMAISSPGVKKKGEIFIIIFKKILHNLGKKFVSFSFECKS